MKGNVSKILYIFKNCRSQLVREIEGGFRGVEKEFHCHPPRMKIRVMVKGKRGERFYRPYYESSPLKVIPFPVNFHASPKHLKKSIMAYLRNYSNKIPKISSFNPFGSPITFFKLHRSQFFFLNLLFCTCWENSRKCKEGYHFEKKSGRVAKKLAKIVTFSHNEMKF